MIFKPKEMVQKNDARKLVASFQIWRREIERYLYVTLQTALSVWRHSLKNNRKMGDTSDSVYRHYLMKRYWERKNAYELPKFLPYEDAYLDLDENPYNNTREPKTQVNDNALDSMINRVLTNQAISLAEGKEYHEEFESNPLGYQSG